MNIINQFLGKAVNQDIVNIDEGLSRRGDINAMFEGAAYRPSYIRALPQVKQHQIWTVKNIYIDYEGQRQSLCHPMMVLLTSECEDLDEDTSFVRGCPISPFIEMASDDDLVCRDASLIGFPFLIESWNEQPMLVDILDKFVADFYTEVIELDSTVDDYQQSFRDIEISNAMFLNRSIIAYMSEMERADGFSFSVDFISGSNVRTIYMPKLHEQSPKLIPLTGHAEYAMAARSGNILTENDCIEIDSVDIPFRIEVRKKNSEYILTIIPKVDIELSRNGKTFDYQSNDERIVYSGLKRGLYDIKTTLTSEKITIRLK